MIVSVKLFFEGGGGREGKHLGIKVALSSRVGGGRGNHNLPTITPPLSDIFFLARLSY